MYAMRYIRHTFYHENLRIYFMTFVAKFRFLSVHVSTSRSEEKNSGIAACGHVNADENGARRSEVCYTTFLWRTVCGNMQKESAFSAANHHHHHHHNKHGRVVQLTAPLLRRIYWEKGWWEWMAKRWEKHKNFEKYTTYCSYWSWCQGSLFCHSKRLGTFREPYGNCFFSLLLFSLCCHKMTKVVCF